MHQFDFYHLVMVLVVTASDCSASFYLVMLVMVLVVKASDCSASYYLVMLVMVMVLVVKASDW